MSLRAQIAEARADLVIILGDDQNENLTSANMPQLALYTGGDFILNRRGAASRARYKSHSEFARALLGARRARGIRLRLSRSLPR